MTVNFSVDVQIDYRVKFDQYLGIKQWEKCWMFLLAKQSFTCKILLDIFLKLC